MLVRRHFVLGDSGSLPKIGNLLSDPYCHQGGKSFLPVRLQVQNRLLGFGPLRPTAQTAHQEQRH